MSLIGDIFEAIFEVILSPIIKGFAQIVSTLLKFAFDSVLMPLLTSVFEVVFPFTVELICDLLVDLIYFVFSEMCWVIDILQNAFNIFSGISNVTDLKGNEGPILTVLLFQDEVMTLFKWMMIIGITLSLVLAIVAVVRSLIDPDFDGRETPKTILKNFFRAQLSYWTLLLSVFFIIFLSNCLINYANNYIRQSNMENPGSLGCVVFSIASLQASNDNMNLYNGNFLNNKDANLICAGNRASFYSGQISYKNVDKVKENFNISNFDYLVGFVIAFFLIFCLLMTMIVFIQRIFEALTLFVTSPFFVAFIPLDEGSKYKKWRELFIGKIFSGFGAVVAMNLYLTLIPVILDDDLHFGETTVAAEYLIKIILIVGGAWSSYKIGPVITTLVSQSAGSAENVTNSAIGQYANTAASYSVSLAAKPAMMLSSFAGKGVNKVANSALNHTPFGNRAESKAIADEKFQNMLKKQQEEFPDKKKDKASGSDSDKKSGDLNNSKDKVLNIDTESGSNSDKNGKFDSDSGSDKNNSDSKSDDKKFALNGKRKTKSSLDKKLASIHRVLPHKVNPDGSYSFGFLGFKLNYDKSGNRKGISLPFVKMKYDKDGKLKVSKLKIPGICSIKRGDRTGKFSLSSIPIFGLKRTEGKDGQFHLTKLSPLGINRQEDNNGKYHMSSIVGIKFGLSYDKESGDYKRSGVRIGNMIFGDSDNDKSEDNKSDNNK